MILMQFSSWFYLERKKITEVKTEAIENKATIIASFMFYLKASNWNSWPIFFVLAKKTECDSFLSAKHAIYLQQQLHSRISLSHAEDYNFAYLIVPSNLVEPLFFFFAQWFFWTLTEWFYVCEPYRIQSVLS